MTLTLDQFIEAYHGSFTNRNLVYKKAKFIEHGAVFLLRSMAYLLLTLTKVFLSFFTTRIESKETVFVSWSPLHTRLARRIGQGDNVVEINNRLSKDQISLYKGISIVKAYQIARAVFKANSGRERTGYDNFFFCFSFMLEFRMLDNLVKDSRHVLMAGQLDRYAIMLSILCRHGKKYFSFVQHGVNNMFEGLYRLHADEIYYLFEISIPFFKSFVLDAENKKYLPIPSVKPNFKADPRYTNAIAFASQIMESDLQILDIMVEHYHKGDILIYPHPTEKSWDVYKKYKSNKRVFITRERISNLDYVISTGSTLGLEYDLIGVKPVFINLNNLESEIFHSDKFIKFDDIDSFRNWFLNVVAR